VSTVRVIARRAIRDQRRAPLWWGIPLGLMSALELAVYPSVHESLGKALDSYPDALKSAFQIESINSAAEFLNGEMFSLVIPLALGFFGIRAAERLIVGYEEHHWLDTLMAAPVSRRALVGGAFAASAAISAGILLVTGLIIWVSGAIFGASIDAGHVLAGVAEVWPLALTFAALALLLSSLMTGSATVTAIAGGILVAMYVIELTARIADSVSAIGPISVFHYLGSALVNGLDAASFFGMTAAACVIAAVAAVLFERRDLRG
jgi:ABC-2 type transport system permease protein